MPSNLMLIAEIGGNHEGDLKKAKELARLAISAGAQVVKYQIYTGKGLVCHSEDPDKVRHFNRFALAKKQYHELAEYVQKMGAVFNASVWEENWITEFDKYLTFYKIGSGDLTAYSIIERIIQTGKPIVISTGLSNLDEIKECINFILQKDKRYKNPQMLGLLQCTSMYPIPDNEANLAVMDTLRDEFPYARIGYSDHTIGIEAVKTAISRGAEIIEVHFSDDNKQTGFRDHLVSFEASDLKEVLLHKQKVDVLIGSNQKKPTKSEIDSGHVNSFRRGLYFNKKKFAGEIVTRSDLVALRPNFGIDARDFELLVGKKLLVDVDQLTRLDYSFFSE